MKGFHFILIAIFMLSPSLATANCTKTAVEEVLSRNGYTYEFAGTVSEGDGNAFSITKDGGRFRLIADLDGDLSFRKYFNNNLELTNDETATVMAEFKYLQVYIDSDGDVAMAYDVALWGEPRCSFDLNQNIKFFMGLVSGAEQTLAK